MESNPLQAMLGAFPMWKIPAAMSPCIAGNLGPGENEKNIFDIKIRCPRNMTTPDYFNFANYQFVIQSCAFSLNHPLSAGILSTFTNFASTFFAGFPHMHSDMALHQIGNNEYILEAKLYFDNYTQLLNGVPAGGK